MELGRLNTEDARLEAILEYYLREYFKVRKAAIVESIRSNPNIINKEYSVAQLDAEVEEIVAEASEKINKSILFVLDLYTLGYRREVREFESAFVDLLNNKVLSKFRDIVKDHFTGVIHVV